MLQPGNGHKTHGHLCPTPLRGIKLAISKQMSRKDHCTAQVDRSSQGVLADRGVLAWIRKSNPHVQKLTSRRRPDETTLKYDQRMREVKFCTWVSDMTTLLTVKPKLRSLLLVAASAAAAAALALAVLLLVLLLPSPPATCSCKLPQTLHQ